MFRSVSVVALTLGGLLLGCGGMPEEGRSIEPQESQAPESDVFQSAVTSTAIYGATVTFNSYGDVFTVKDTAGDGRSAVAQIYNYNTGNTSYCWNSSGAGTSTTCNRNFAEGILIRYRACTSNAPNPPTAGNCGEWRTASTAN
ncbi:hypothetical protein [Corallococcus exercitus]|uniref:Uncharacterized protein n=1 Tax=Corallococcus exercitus TaxID=2316736 RepID=A0A7Y4NCM4_9BACT|nr:hypothetical protein [Corallococcus exercitus]NOK09024.1 hypothetical protein [Corallococcus exercitus]